MAGRKRKTKVQKNGKTDGKPGRPRRKYTAEQIEKIKQYALANAHTLTIANALGIPETSLRQDFSELLIQKRAEGKIAALMYQFNQARKNPTMAIWWGKQHLDQTDKKSVEAAIATTGMSDEEANQIRKSLRNRFNQKKGI